jgi:hypothetical protein
MPGAPTHPQPRVVKEKHTSVVTASFAGNIPAFPARMVYDLFRALPGDRLCVSVTSAMRKHCRQLGASVETSGPHGFVVRSHLRSSGAVKTSIASSA